MLAIAGSHLDIVTDSPTRTVALHHRQKAIEGLENAFSKGSPSPDEAQLMLAASYLLAFQSGFLVDGFLDHILSIRGCATLSQLILSTERIETFIVQGSLHAKIMESTWHHLVRMDQEIALEALESVRDLGRLTAESHAHDIEKALLVQFTNVLRNLLHQDVISQEVLDQAEIVSNTLFMTHPYADTDPTPFGTWQPVLNPFVAPETFAEFDEIDWDNVMTPIEGANPIRSFNALMATMTILATWPQDAITHLFDASNTLGQIILVHFCAIRFIITPMTAPKDAMQMPARAIVEWIARLIERLMADDDVSVRQYIRWPQKILRCMQANVAKNPGLTFLDLRDVIVNDPGAFKEGRAVRSYKNDRPEAKMNKV